MRIGLAAAFAAALAAAPAPAAAQAAGDTMLVHLGPEDGGTRAFVAWPPGTREAPAVVLIHEWWGLNTQIRHQARRLARQGYVVIVPDLYHGIVAENAERAHELSRGLDEDRAVADLLAAIKWVRSQEPLVHEPIGAMGFCMGGRYALELALRSDAIACAVVFYGRPETDVDRLRKLKAPIMAHFGAEDRGIPPERARAFEEALEKAGKKGQVYVYGGAGHAFMNETRASYHPDAAKLAWARTLAFLQKHLKNRERR